MSYNGDLRGIAEDMLGKGCVVRSSISSFTSLGAAIDRTTMFATVPDIVAPVELRWRVAHHPLV